MSKFDDLLDEMKVDVETFADDMKEKYTEKLRDLAQDEIADLFANLLKRV